MQCEKKVTRRRVRGVRGERVLCRTPLESPKLSGWPWTKGRTVRCWRSEKRRDESGQGTCGVRVDGGGSEPGGRGVISV